MNSGINTDWVEGFIEATRGAEDVPPTGVVSPKRGVPPNYKDRSTCPGAPAMTSKEACSCGPADHRDSFCEIHGDEAQETSPPRGLAE